MALYGYFEIGAQTNVGAELKIAEQELAVQPSEVRPSPQPAFAEPDELLTYAIQLKRVAVVDETVSTLVNISRLSLSPVVCATVCIAPFELDLAVLRVMKTYSASEDVQVYGCMVLATLALNAENRQLMMERSAHIAIIRAMQLFEQNGSLQHWALRFLSLIAVDYENKIAMLEPGKRGLLAVLAVMRQHLQDENVQAFGCRALAGLAVDAQSVWQAQETILVAIKTHVHVVSVQASGLLALATLVWNLQKTPLNGYIGLHTYEAVLYSMQLHAQQLSVELYGCITLFALLLNPSFLQVYSVSMKLRVYEIVWRAMDIHISSPCLQRLGCSIIAHSPLTNSTKDVDMLLNTARQSQGRIQTAMIAHHSDVSITACAIFAFTNMCLNVVVRDWLVGPDCMVQTAIYEALHARPLSINIQFHGCFAIANMALGCKVVPFLQSAQIAYSLVLSAMRAHRNVETLQAAACIAIGNLMSIDHMLEIDISTNDMGGVADILGALQRYPISTGIQSAGCFTLPFLLKRIHQIDHDRFLLLLKPPFNVHVAILQIMLANADAVRVQINGCFALCELARISQNVVCLLLEKPQYAHQIVMLALQMHGNDNTVHESALSFFAITTSNLPETKVLELFLNPPYQIHVKVMEVLRSFPWTESAQEAGVEILARLVFDDDYEFQSSRGVRKKVLATLKNAGAEQLIRLAVRNYVQNRAIQLSGGHLLLNFEKETFWGGLMYGVWSIFT